ncbi:uncharacterized protein EI90DRAFT_2683837 [Cantharellus anzutake]|uniref:uncharacterized protein n=1 Tax=Cantharellus anzutake TaxID=1750568 RepID=UPI001906F40E|nr:uncharacterized protein EI90DRAFT_2683837 [Cantharellus anzutake]KAF8319256.1 hypothetical protein EI90DRAFT_2683837 [Cantharellus anzutake]
MNPQLAASAFKDPRMIQVMGVLMGIDMQGFARPGGSDEVPQGFEPSSPVPPTPSASTSNHPTSPKPASSSKHQPPPAPASEPVDAPMSGAGEDDEEAKDKAEALKEKQLGNSAYKRRDFENAEKHFLAAWDKWPKDITFLTNLAAAHFEDGDYQKSIEVCEKAIDEGRSIRADYRLIAKAFGRIGTSYAKLDDLESAIKFYGKSLAEHRTPDILGKLNEAQKLKRERDLQAYINPELSAVAREEGNALFKAGDFAESVKSYTEAIKRDPEDPKAYNNRAAAYTKLAALPEALKDAEKAIEIDPAFGLYIVLVAFATYLTWRPTNQSRDTFEKQPSCMACVSTLKLWRPATKQPMLTPNTSTSVKSSRSCRRFR